MSKAAKILALCVNTATSSGSPTWLRVKKSTALTVSQNPETEDFDYIADEVKTTEIKAYAPTIDQDLAILPTEPDYEFFYKMYKDLPTGSDAHKQFLLIYLSDGNNEEGFYSVKTEGVVTFNDYNAVDGKLNFSIAFCGTPVKGKTTVSSGTYTFTESVASSLSTGE